MAGENPNLTVTALNINALNSPNKRQGFSEWTKLSDYIFSMRSILYQNSQRNRQFNFPALNPFGHLSLSAGKSGSFPGTFQKSISKGTFQKMKESN